MRGGADEGRVLVVEIGVGAGLLEVGRDEEEEAVLQVLMPVYGIHQALGEAERLVLKRPTIGVGEVRGVADAGGAIRQIVFAQLPRDQIGRASCRERV